MSVPSHDVSQDWVKAFLDLLLLVETVGGGLGFLRAAEGDEAETAVAASLTVSHDDLSHQLLVRYSPASS